MIRIAYCEKNGTVMSVFETNDIATFTWMVSTLQFLGDEILEISGYVRGGR